MSLNLHYSAAALLLSGTLFTGCGDSNGSKHEPLNLSIIHVNDTHSHLDSESYSLKFNGVSTTTEIGGYPRVITKIGALQNASENTLTLNAGDTFQGTLYYSLFKGDADAAMLNLIKWDALELGNHEFDDGDAQLANYLGKLATADIIAANVEPAKSSVLAGMWEPYVIKTYSNGERVGVIGIDIVQKTQVSSNPGDDIAFSEEIATAQKYINVLQNKGINKIVLLTHQGYETDVAMASKLKGVDVIIGGDSHTLLGDFSSVGLTTPAGYDYPTVTVNASGETVCVAQAWQYAYVVGNMSVDFDEKGVVESCGGTATLLMGESFVQKDAATGTSAEVTGATRDAIMNVINTHANLEIVAKNATAEAALASYRSQVDAQKATIIGSSSEFLGHNRIPGDAYDKVAALPLGSDIAPIVSKAFYDLSNRADACIQNAGGVRIAVPEGEITMNTAYTLLPFANTLFEIDMYGSEIKQVLEDALTNYLDNGGSTGSFPYAYGLRYDIDTTQAANHRISNLEIKNRTTGTWSAIDDNAMYVIVSNNFTAAGNDGYVTFATVQAERGLGIDTYLDYALSFVRYVENLTAEGKSLSKLPAEEHPIKSFK